MDDWTRQIDQYLDGTLDAHEIEALFAWLAESPQNAEVFARQCLVDQHLDELLDNGSIEPVKGAQIEENLAPLPRTPRPTPIRTRLMPITAWVSAVAAAIVITLGAAAFFHFADHQRTVATITGLTGALQWTGDGGRIVYDLGVGKQLSGGTIEGTTPNAWFEFEYHDGSAITISGISSLTFSDRGQKILHLKEGKMTGHVMPQPAGKPMLIHTPTAILEVVGTQFEVQAELAATMLNVSEGEVRVKRLSDGQTVKVKAKHRVVAADDRALEPVSVPEAVNRWTSQLHLGPEGTYGRWSAKTAAEEAKLETIPLTIPQGLTIYAAALGVSQGDEPPVVLQPGCRLRVRGHMASTHDVYFGVNVRYLSGGFAGRFQIIRPAVEFSSGEDFDILLDLQAFWLDPSLSKIADKLPGTPLHLVVEGIWCHTLDQPSGLAITEVVLLPPTASVNLVPDVLQPPVMDIWAATSQGNLEVVKHHLDAGTDINAAFIAPGIFASGATPLHMAVLSDQQEVARFLIGQGANVNAPALDEYGGTPLHWAAVLGRVAIATQLIDTGANVNAIDKNGYTPLDATALEAFSESKTRLAVAELLRQRGAKSRDEIIKP